MSLSHPSLTLNGVHRPARFAVREHVQPPAGYEPEHGERQVSGSVKVASGARWFGTLAVPLTGDQTLLVTVERDGPVAPGAPEVHSLDLVIPPGEAEAVITLLQGLVEQAKRDGVL
jgi:hypothetical protein